MDKIASDILKNWSDLLPNLDFWQQNSQGFMENPFDSDRSQISAFMSHTILSLFEQEKQGKIKRDIQEILTCFETAKIKKISLNNDSTQEIGNKLSGLVQLLENSDSKILFLAEQNKKILSFIQNKTKEIDDKAKQVFEEKLPRFLASSFAREAKKLGKQIENKESLFLFSISIIIVGFLCIDKSHYVNYIPLFLPIIWGLWFLTKSINQDKRLFHEYKHKEVLARTYRIYADQIAKYSDYLLYADSNQRQIYEELAFYFLQKNLDVLMNNPAKTLGRESRTNPYLDTFSKLTEMIRKEKTS